MLRVLTAEWTKLRTTRGPWISSLVGVLLILLINELDIFLSTSDHPVVYPAGLVDGFLFLMYIVAVLATLAATSDFGFGTGRLSLLASPSRWRNYLGKLILVGSAAAALCVATLAIVYAVGVPSALVKGDFELGDTKVFLHATVGWVVTFLIIALWGVALGTLVKRSAAGVTLILLWPFLENLAFIIPRIGRDIYRWLPFHNLNAFLGEDAPLDSVDGVLESSTRWIDSWQASALSVLVFTVVFIILVGIVNSRRDY